MQTRRCKILVNLPYLNDHGGVVNHFVGLKSYWASDVKYNVIGKRNAWKGSGLLFMPYDIIKFIWRIWFWKPYAVLLNPSLNKSAVTRDCIFLRISAAMRKRTFVMFHGWREDYAKKAGGAVLAQKLNRAKGIMVLCSTFKDELISWGVQVPIHLVTTKVDDKLIGSFDINRNYRKEIKKILFLSRIEKTKGIFEALDCFESLLSNHPELQLNVVGDGSALEEAKTIVKNRNIRNVNFKGYLSGQALAKQFVENDVYLFPSYTEGMPTSVLEAMAFGLPIITRPVGGLIDFFENGKMGQMIDSFNPSDFANSIETLINAPSNIESISRYNHEYAITHFLASKVARAMETILAKD